MLTSTRSAGMTSSLPAGAVSWHGLPQRGLLPLVQVKGSPTCAHSHCRLPRLLSQLCHLHLQPADCPCGVPQHLQVQPHSCNAGHLQCAQCG